MGGSAVTLTPIHDLANTVFESRRIAKTSVILTKIQPCTIMNHKKILYISE